MSEESRIRELVTSAVAEAFDLHVRALHDEVVDRVMQTVQPALEVQSAQLLGTLNSAVQAIQTTSTQVDVLEALLQGTAKFAPRAAILVFRGTTAVAWNASGFRDNARVKAFSVGTTSGLCARAVQQHSPVSGPAAQFDSHFIATFGSPSADCVVAPLIVRDKILALVYADAGESGAQTPNTHYLAILARSAANWIELCTLRNAARTTATTVPPRSEIGTGQPATAAAESPDSAAPISSDEMRRTEHAASVATLVPKREPVGVPGSAIGSPSSVVVMPSTASQEPSFEPATGHEDLHRKARRFAKLLVDEIVLYNRDKVTAGRLQRDLYDRLREDIDKSRATYEKRYGQTSVASNDYFTQALVGGLADHNASLMGPNFPLGSPHPMHCAL